MKTLVLPIKRRWFKQIFGNIKKEEYREIKPYYTTRFQKKYDAIEFRNGYGKKVPHGIVELKEIKKGPGKTEWGAVEGEVYYVLVLGNILKNPWPLYMK